MPRYFFHIVGNDDDGTELPDDAAACEQARETFGAMIREGAVSGPAQMEVVDARGQRVVLLRFSAEQ